MKKKKKKGSNKGQAAATRKKTANLYLTFLICWFAQTFLSIWNWQTFFPAYPIVMGLLSIPTIILIWRPEEDRPDQQAKILTSAIVLLWRLPALLLPYRIVLLIDMALLLLLVVQLCYILFVRIKTLEKTASEFAIVWMMEAISIAWLLIFRSMMDYVVQDDDFWKISLITSLIAGAVITLLCFWKNHRFGQGWEYFCLPFFSFL